jgi:hypothetical protein
VIALQVILFDILLAACYLFVSTREATAVGLLLTVFLALLAIVLFLVIQGVAVSYPWKESKVAKLFLDALRSAGKLAVVTLPILLIGGLLAYLFLKIDWSPGASELNETMSRAGDRTADPFPWKSFFVTAIQYLLYAFALPLVAIHYWIVAMRESLPRTLAATGRVLRAAFSPTSVLIYLLGLLAFGVVPYFVFFTRTPINQAWVEIIVLGLRLALGFLFVLFGWTLTLGALSERMVATPQIVPAATPATTPPPPPATEEPTAAAPAE